MPRSAGTPVVASGPMATSSDHSAAGISSRAFAVRRKGFDPDEVQAYLGQLAEIVGRLTAERDAARTEIATLRAAAEERPMVDEDQLTAALGEETARVLTSAHKAAGVKRALQLAQVAAKWNSVFSKCKVSLPPEKPANNNQSVVVVPVDELGNLVSDYLKDKTMETIEKMERMDLEDRDRVVEDGFVMIREESGGMEID